RAGRDREPAGRPAIADRARGGSGDVRVLYQLAVFPVDRGVCVAESKCGRAVSEYEGQRVGLAARGGPDVRAGGRSYGGNESRKDCAIRNTAAASRADACDVRDAFQCAVLVGGGGSDEREGAVSDSRDRVFQAVLPWPLRQRAVS